MSNISYTIKENGKETKRQITEAEIEQIILNGGEILVKKAKMIGQDLVKLDLTTTQIRNIFNEVKKMQMKGFDWNKFLLLKPKLAYASARPGAKNGTRVIKDVLTMAIDKVNNKEVNFENFVDFFEAILAYHREAGGK